MTYLDCIYIGRETSVKNSRGRNVTKRVAPLNSKILKVNQKGETYYDPDNEVWVFRAVTKSGVSEEVVVRLGDIKLI